MSRTRIIGGNNIKTIGGDYLIHSDESIEFSSRGKIYEDAKDNISLGDFEKRAESKTEYFVDGEWLDKDGKHFNRTRKGDGKFADAVIGDKVYFRLKTQNLPVGTPIIFELMEYDGSVLLPLMGGRMVEARPFDDVVPFYDTNDKGNTKVVGNVGENGYIMLGVTTTEILEPFIDDDHGATIELYFKCTYAGHEVDTFPKSTEKYLTVAHTERTIFLKPATEGYRMPEIIDPLGEFIVFLANESGDVVGSFDATIQHFHTVKIKILKEYAYHSNFNAITKKIYKETYNMDTGLNTHQDLFKETEKVEFRIKKDSKQIFKEEEYTQNVKKRIADYYNANDIGKTGLKGVQRTLDVLGYLDYWNDLSSIAKGEKVPMYDATGAVVTTIELGTAAAGSPITIPIWANAILFGMAVFEATIVAQAVRDMDDFIENAMKVDLENAKLKGKEGMRSLFRSNDYFSLKNYNYRLLTDIPQEILNEIFTGKRKKYNSIELDLGKYPYSSQFYDMLFKVLPENEKVADRQYLLETIIMH